MINKKDINKKMCELTHTIPMKPKEMLLKES
jgi:hypothetical protein